MLSLFLLATAITLAIGIGSARANGDGQWKQLSGSPSARENAGYAYDSQRNRLLVFGGTSPALNDVHAFDLTTNSWSSVSTQGTPPSPRYGASAIYDAVRDRLIVFGGIDGSAELNDVYALTLSDPPTWSQLNPSGSPPPTRSFHAAGFDAGGDRMIIFGGSSEGLEALDTWSLSLGDSPGWALLSSSGPPTLARKMAGSAIDPVGNRLIVFGGWRGGYLSDTWVLPLTGPPVWSTITTAHAPVARRLASLVWDSKNNRAVTFGGESGPYGTKVSDIWALNLTGTPDWQAISPPAGPSARSGYAAAFDPTLDRMVVFSGAESPGTVNDTWSLSLDASPQWQQLETPLVPVRNLTAQYDALGQRMVIFGGEETGPADILNSDIRVLPLTGAHADWTTLQVAGPSGRRSPSSIWDPVSDRMLVFGGRSTAYPYELNDIWEFHPRPNPYWVVPTTVGTPPGGRELSTAIYDPQGDRMILFGGFNANSATYYNDLWELPLRGTNMNRWHQLTPTGLLPSGRWGHLMVYDPTRQRAIVTGGTSNSSAALSDIYTLDLSVSPPAWAPLATSGLPTPGLYLQAGIFDPTGDRLIVFGGYDGMVEGAAYALSFTGPPTWTLLSPLGPGPSPRDAMASIYDPVHSAMTMIGGTDANNFLNDTWALTIGSTVGVSVGPQSLGGLALAGVQPNPSIGDAMRVAFTLERKGPARLDLIDVAGRRVASRDLSTLEAGPHVIAVSGDAPLMPGLYLLRLTAGDRSLTAKAFVVR